jgi:hypothetical protein
VVKDFAIFVYKSSIQSLGFLVKNTLKLGYVQFVKTFVFVLNAVGSELKQVKLNLNS